MNTLESQIHLLKYLEYCKKALKNIEKLNKIDSNNLYEILYIKYSIKDRLFKFSENKEAIRSLTQIFDGINSIVSSLSEKDYDNILKNKIDTNKTKEINELKYNVIQRTKKNTVRKLAKDNICELLKIKKKNFNCNGENLEVCYILGLNRVQYIMDKCTKLFTYLPWDLLCDNYYLFENDRKIIYQHVELWEEQINSAKDDGLSTIAVRLLRIKIDLEYLSGIEELKAAAQAEVYYNEIIRILSELEYFKDNKYIHNERLLIAAQDLDFD